MKSQEIGAFVFTANYDDDDDDDANDDDDDGDLDDYGRKKTNCLNMQEEFNFSTGPII